MFADLSEALVDAGKVAGSITAILALVGLLSKTRLAKLIWRRLVSDPFAVWLQGQQAEAIEPVVKTVAEVSAALIDHMAAEEAKADADRSDRESRQFQLDVWRDRVDDRLDEGNRRFGSIESKLDEAIGRR